VAALELEEDELDPEVPQPDNPKTMAAKIMHPSALFLAEEEPNRTRNSNPARVISAS
jgi:hypothetical protein